MRLDKMLSDMKIASRKEIGKLAKKGVITVNGEVVTKPATHIDENTDEVRIYDEIIEYRKYLYFVMNKRKGVISHTTDPKYKTVIDDMGEFAVFNLFPVGRLDLDTTGLLVITNDGKLSHALTSPKNKVEKTYLVELRDPIEEDRYRKVFEKGIRFEAEDFTTKPAKLQVIDESSCYLTIYEGKFHQVKRMFHHVGNEVLELKRVSLGKLDLPDDLEEGDFREMTDEELDLLKTSCEN
ncbi:MAG: pseudouridine synthase [Finegoldia sp.]|nr:pseudouridine synthase [Finegoldia sp.]